MSFSALLPRKLTPETHCTHRSVSECNHKGSKGRLGGSFHFTPSAPLGRAAVTEVGHVDHEALAQRGVATMAAARVHH